MTGKYYDALKAMTDCFILMYIPKHIISVIPYLNYYLLYIIFITFYIIIL